MSAPLAGPARAARPATATSATGHGSAGSQPAGLAILGTGKMGAAIAERLAGAGYEIALWNRTRTRAASLGLGRVAETPAAAVRGADFVISSLTGAEAIRAAFLGADGALRSARPGALFVDVSTAGPEIVSELEPLVAAAGARLIAVPIMGAPTVVLAGAATLLAGGDRAAVDLARPLLERLGLVRHVGSPTDAARLKLIANSMLALVVGGAAELQRAGTAAGLDPRDVFWVLSRLAPGLEARRDGFVDDAQRPALFAIRDLHKDLTLAAEAFGADASIGPLFAQARQLVAAAAGRLPDEDIAALRWLARPVGDDPPRALSATSDRHGDAPAGV